MFLLPSLPFGSASGGKTQPLLHPSPADRDERGGLMQSSWPALPAPAGSAHPTTNTAELLRRCAASSPALRGAPRDLLGLGQGCCSSSRALSPIPVLSAAPLGPPRCCQRMGIPWDLQHPASPAAGGDGVWQQVPRLWLLPRLSPPKLRLCVCSAAASGLCACCKSIGQRHRETLPLIPTWLQQGKGLQACPHWAGATAGGTLPIMEPFTTLTFL